MHYRPFSLYTCYHRKDNFYKQGLFCSKVDRLRSCLLIGRVINELKVQQARRDPAYR